MPGGHDSFAMRILVPILLAVIADAKDDQRDAELDVMLATLRDP